MSASHDDDPGTLPRLMAAYGHVGAMFPIAIGLGMLAGYWLDERLGTSPWLMFAGFGLGVVAALRNLIQAVQRQDRRERERAEAELRERRRVRRGDGGARGDEGPSDRGRVNGR